MENYTGVGALPSYEQMQYIIHEIRSKSQNTHLSFVGEKSTGDFERYKNLGLSTGTGFIDPNDFHTVRDEAINFAEHIVVLKCEYEENIKRSIKDNRDSEQVERGMR